MAVVRDNLVKSIVQRIARSIKPERIILFGSRADATGRDDSDVDLLIIYNGSLSKRQVKLQIRKLFPHPDFSLDVFVLTPEEFEKQKKIANTLAREASDKGVVCYAG
ncbi:MAG: nucleotidyltransferase domain-containing protein [bacterium]|nr:nucleotidyltransferase domain-containing protein [bacterium]